MTSSRIPNIYTDIFPVTFVVAFKPWGEGTGMGRTASCRLGFGVGIGVVHGTTDGARSYRQTAPF